MGSKWKTIKLGEICNFRAGNAFPKDRQGLSKGDFPFIKVSDMGHGKNGWYILQSQNWVSAETIHLLRLRIHPRSASVFAKIGEAIKANRVRMLSRETVIDNNMMAATANDGTSPVFLHYLLKFCRLSNWADGSALPYLKQKTLIEIPVTIPCDVGEQKRIASLLALLDMKIELNNRINDYLAA